MWTSRKSPKECDSTGHFIVPSEVCIDPSRTGGAHLFKWLNPNGDVDTGVTCSYKLVTGLAKTAFTGLAALCYRPFDDPAGSAE